MQIKYYDEFLKRKSVVGFKRVNGTHWRMSQEGSSRVLTALETRRMIYDLTAPANDKHRIQRWPANQVEFPNGG